MRPLALDRCPLAALSLVTGMNCFMDVVTYMFCIF